jgi:hypothetical protein
MAKSTDIKWKFMKLNGVLNRAYKVSNHGDIVHAKTMEPLKQKTLDKKSPKNGSDYMAVYIKGVKSPVRVHRIVCETFHGQAKNGKTIVDHLDEYKDNNTATNLQWVTSAENSKRYFEKNGAVRHSLATIVRTKKLLNKGLSNDAVAQKVGMSDSNVSVIKLGRIHTGVKPYTVDQVVLGNVG